jgi:hypothetical protein
MTRRRANLPPGNWKRVARIKIDPPATLSSGFGPIVVEHILNNFYIDRGTIKRRKLPLLKELTWAEKINRRKGIC